MYCCVTCTKKDILPYDFNVTNRKLFFILYFKCDVMVSYPVVKILSHLSGGEESYFPYPQTGGESDFPYLQTGVKIRFTTIPIKRF